MKINYAESGHRLRKLEASVRDFEYTVKPGFILYIRYSDSIYIRVYIVCDIKLQAVYGILSTR